MPRLPVPGQDDGVWGDILNEFLSVELNNAGQLKKATDITTAQQAADDAQTAADAAQTTANAAIPASQKGQASGVASLDSSGRLPNGQASVAIPQTTKTGSHTLVLADAGYMIEVDSASATTITVPASSIVAFADGTVIGVRQYGAGQVSIAAGDGVTLRSRGAATKLAGQYSEATISKRTGDEWVLSGDLVT